MTITIDEINLARGAHDDPESGMCLLEAVAYVAGEEHSDHPACTSPVLGAFGRSLNDVLPDDKRQKLRDYIPAMIGTAGDGLDEQRSYIALDWLIRTWMATFLDLHDRTRGHAAAVRALPPIVGIATAEKAVLVVRAAGAAARDFLAPTVSELQDSAIALMPRLIAGTPNEGNTNG